jgi:hypothetical protein
MRLKIYKTIILKRRNARANSKLNEAKITTFTFYSIQVIAFEFTKYHLNLMKSEIDLFNF